MNYTRNRFLLILWILMISFIFKPIFKGNAPIPLDVMVGGYYPWLDHKWGYAVGVPYKNTSLTDVFSQLYPWRALAIDMLHQGELPLWNKFSFSGTPLLANWQSAPFYPFNILMIILGNIWGWSGMVIIEPFLAGIFFYLMLRIHTIGKLESFSGGVVFALSGFMTTYMEYNTAGQIFMWVPLLIICAKKYLLTLKVKYLWYTPWIIFYILSGGFFQPALYALAITCFYWFWSKINIKKILIYFGLGITMSAIQLIPTAELLNHSIRNLDPNITNYNFGLMPVKMLITLLAPDFFGSPVTGNYYGFMGYQETTGYAGILAIVLIPGAIFISKKEVNPLKYTAILFLTISLLLAFDNSVSRLVYNYKLPLISTGYASRNLLFVSFSLAVLTSIGLTNLKGHKNNSILILGLLGGLTAGYFICQKVIPIELAVNIKVTLRNLVIPTIIAVFVYGILTINIKREIRLAALIALLALDLIRFSGKFLPFSKADFAYLKVPAIEYLKTNIGNYRIERDQATLPPNTWLYFGLSTPSGYDPLFSRDYAKFYQVYNRGSFSGEGLSRYAETENWDSPLIDLAGVKYILTTKKIKGVIDKNGTDAGYKFDSNRYKQVFSDNISLILENKNVMPNNNIYSAFEVAADDSAFRLLAKKFDITQKIILDKRPDINLQKEDILFVNDAYYPGWKAYVNNRETYIYKAFGAFRAVVVPKGETYVKFVYFPNSFLWGLLLTLSTIAILGIWRWRQEQYGQER